MRDMKQRERKQRHQNAWVETARKESAVQKCRIGNCEKWKLRHNVAGVENARHENSGKADYGEPLTANYRYFTAL